MDTYAPALIRIISGFLLTFACVFSGNYRMEAASQQEGPPVGATWIVHVADGTDAQALARSMGADYSGPLVGVDGFHRFSFIEALAAGPDSGDLVIERLSATPQIVAFEEEVWFERFPRRFAPADPLFRDQWHHENTGQLGGLPHADARVRPAWDAGWSGMGTTIAIVDTGTDFRHPDLIENWWVGSGYDYNDNDEDPSPSGPEDRHGTAVAGISLASSNNIGGLGIAHRARLVPLRLIAGSYRSGQEAEALSYRIQEVDIYNNSWGPSDSGGARYSDSSGALKAALASNVLNGRGGLGNIYVWAAGNGGLNRDNSNYDGYNSSPYTISVGAVGDDDVKTGYSEPGANLLVVAPSGGTGAGILTTDNRGASGYDPGDYYDNFNGTSAAAPMVAGVVALMLEARPQLSWRDVQQVLARTAVPVDFNSGTWQRNAAGHWVSHLYGFGRIDAGAATALATQWQLLGPMRKTGFRSAAVSRTLTRGIPVDSTIDIPQNFRIESVQVRVQLNFSNWGDIEIELISPDGTSSILAEPHQSANGAFQPGTWTYLSMRHLDEFSAGTWTLRVTNAGASSTGSFSNWAIDVWGHDAQPLENRPPVAKEIIVDSVEFPVLVETLADAVDPDGDPVEIIAVQQPTFGQIEDLGEGTFSYRMGISENGQDTFSVLLSDGRGGVARQLVIIRDPRPIARRDVYVIAPNQTYSLPVLQNDLDPNGDPLRIVELVPPGVGVAAIQISNRIQYEAPEGFEGIVRMRYTISDDADGFAEAPVTIVVQAEPDVALDFNGISDHLLIPPETGTYLRDQFTAEAWIYARDWGEYVTGFGRIFDNNSFLLFLNGLDHQFYSDRSLVAYFITNDRRAIAFNSIANSLQLDRWHHVAVTFNSFHGTTPVRLYIDGKPVQGTYPLEDAAPPLQAVSNDLVFPLFVGESASGARAFNGLITELRIWNRVLTPTEIEANANLRLAGNEPGLAIYFPFNDSVEPFATSMGIWQGDAQFLNPQRVPRLSPTAAFESRFALGADFDTGWRFDPVFGWLFGDAYPWLYWEPFGWTYFADGEVSGPYAFYPSASTWGWIVTDRRNFPWLYIFGFNQWAFMLQSSDAESFFFFPQDGSWRQARDPAPGAG